MTYTFTTAVRDRVGLLIGLAGASGSGKTLSAFKIARGLAGGDDSKIAVIDTEGGRAKHYAPARGEAPSDRLFAFQHCDLRPPFQPETYLAAIHAADQAGFEVIVIDSFSHSWDGEGGLQDMHDTIAETAVERQRANALEKGWRFDEAAAFDKASIGAWKEPKMRHKRLISRLLQCRAHLVICMRADEKMRMDTVEEAGRNGRTFKKTVIVAPKDMPLAERWVPIVEKRFPYELTTSLLLTPSDPGVPIAIKLQEQHRPSVPLDCQISEQVGRSLAAWARGETAAPAASTGDRQDKPKTGRERLFEAARAAAADGMVALDEFRAGLTEQQDAGLKPILQEITNLASDADARDDDRSADNRSEAA